MPDLSRDGAVGAAGAKAPLDPRGGRRRSILSIKSDAALLAAFVALAEPLAVALGPDTEVVVHDLSKIPNSVIAIANPLTGRSVGAPMTDLLLRRVRQGHTDHAYRYHTKTADGRSIRSSTLFIKSASGDPIGCLCLNSDITPWLRAHQLLGSYVDGEQSTVGAPSPDAVARDGASSEEQEEEEEEFPGTVEDLTVTLLEQVVSRVGVPVALMRKSHKLQVVRQLEEAGVFLIRDAIDYVAEQLQVSRYSIYNYLNELNGGDARPTARRKPTFRGLPRTTADEAATTMSRDEEFH